jgi:type II secretory pathway component HofQ
LLDNHDEELAAATKNTRAESKKIDVKVPKNKSSLKVYMVRAETEERDVQKQKADDGDTPEPPHHHHQEQACRV